MSGASFHVSPSDLEVIGLRPGDKMVLRPRGPITAENAAAIAARMAEVLGDGWGVVISPELDVIVVRADDEPSGIHQV